MFIENRIRVLVIHDRQSKGKKLENQSKRDLATKSGFSVTRVKRNNFAKRRHDKKCLLTASMKTQQFKHRENRKYIEINIQK